MMSSSGLRRGFRTASEYSFTPVFYFATRDHPCSRGRLNWTLIDNPALHQPSMVRRAGRGDLDQWFFRVERQTLRQLPSTRAIVFTIHNYVASAQVMCDAYEDFGDLLVRALDATPDAMQEYKGWRGVADQLREALRQR